MLATTVLDFQEVGGANDVEIGTYERDGYQITTGVSQSNKFRLFGASSPRFAGSAGLSSIWSPTNIVLSRPDGEPFSISTIDLAGYSPGATPYVDFTGTKESGDTVFQRIQTTQFAFKQYDLVGMTDLSELSWAFTSTGNFHQFDDLVLTTGGSDPGAPVANDDAYTVLEGTALDATWPLPTSSLLQMEGDQGDWVSQGDSYFYDDSSGDFRIYKTYSVHNDVTVAYTDANHWWYVNLDAPNTDPLQVGVYTAATRYPFQDPGLPGLSISGDGRGCNQLNGEFEVHAVRYDSGGNPLAIDATFTQSCENKVEQLRGHVRYVKPGILSGVLENDADADGDPLTAQLVTPPANGSLNFQSDGTFTYSPNPGFTGLDVFTYTVSDGTTTSSPAEVTINVQSTNVPPVAVSDSASTDEDTAVTIDVIANDTDANGDALAVTSVSNPPNGTASIDAAGKVRYVPDPNFSGSDSFTYTINDGRGGSDSATVEVAVRTINDAPVAVSNLYSLDEDTPLTVSAGVGTSILDQEQVAGGYQFNGQSTRWQQQVRADASGVLTSVDVYIGPNTSPGAILDFYVNLGSAWQSDIPEFRVQRTLSSSDADSWITIDTSAAGIQLTPGDLFTFGNYPTGTGSLVFAGSYNGQNGDLYPEGQLWRDGSPQVTSSGVGYDLRFRTRVGTPAGVLSNDTDADGDVLTASLVTPTSNGQVTLNPNGSFTYAPNANFYGIDSFTYRANDGTTNSNTALVQLNVAAVNDPPTVADSRVATVFETPIEIDLGALSSDLETPTADLTFAISRMTNGTWHYVNPQKIRFTPNAGFTGEASFLYQAIDQGHAGTAATVSSLGTITIDVFARLQLVTSSGFSENGGPFAGTASVTRYAADLSQDLTVQLSSSDTTEATVPASIVIPAGDQTAIFRIAAIDDTLLDGTQSVTITAQIGSSGPTQSSTVNVYDHETVLLSFDSTDPLDEGDEVTATLTRSTTDNASAATVRFLRNTDPSVVILPTSIAIPADQQSVSFSVPIADNQSPDGTRTVRIETSSNGYITQLADLTVQESSTVTIEAVADGHATDTELDGVFEQVVTSGDVQTWLFPLSVVVPGPREARGVYEFEAPSLGGANILQAGLSLNVTGTQVLATNVVEVYAYAADGVVTVDDALQTAVKVSELAIQSGIPGLQRYTFPLDVAAIQPIIDSASHVGFMTRMINGYRATASSIEYGGPESFRPRLNLILNDPPTATDDSATTAEDMAVVVDVLANDSDPSGDALSVSAVGIPVSGTAVINANGTITYTPNSNFNGADSFTYTISDGNGGSDTAAVNVIVNPVNDNPAASDDSAATDEDNSVTIAVLDNDSDLDGDSLSVSTASNPANGSVVIKVNGTITYTPNANFNGPDSFTYTISDGNGGSDTAAVNVVVNAVNDDPEAIDVDAVFAIEENSPKGTEIGAIEAVDVDGDDLAYSLSGADAAAFAIDSQTGMISVTDAALLDFETDPDFDFMVEISDGHGGHATASVRINLTDVAEVAEVAIDVLPNDPDNQISLRSKEIEVAIIGSAGFDPSTMVDLSKVRLIGSGSSTGAGIQYSRKRGFKVEQRDVNGDGVLDLVMKFKTSEIGLQAGDTSVRLVGDLRPEYGGDSFSVDQSVTVSGGGGGKGKKK